MYANNVEIEKVLKTATPGPWEFDESDDGHEIRMGEAISSPYMYSSHLVIEYNHGVYPEDGKQYEEAEANAQLIANAPKWLEQLLKENERLVENNVKHRQEATNEREQSESIVAERERLYIQVEEMKKVLEWYADKQNYEFYGMGVAVNEDKGEIARNALESRN